MLFGERKPGLNISRKAHVPSFTVTRGEGALALVHQVRVRPAIRNLKLVGMVGRCMGVSRGMTSLVDIELASGEEVRRVDGLPSFHNIHYLPSGWGIATKRTTLAAPLHGSHLSAHSCRAATDSKAVYLT